MTTVFPVSGATTPPTSEPRAARSPDDQFGQDTFLKLLVAQLKYQDPLAPTEGSEFIAQTAQFTQLETLQKIAKQQDALAKSNAMLAAASMVGRSVGYALKEAGDPRAGTPTGTTAMSVRGTLPKEATVGTTVDTRTDVFTRTGRRVTLTLRFTRTADTWTVQARHDGRALGSPAALRFDASGDRAADTVTIPASALDTIGGTAQSWPATGITLAFGATDDPARLQLASGPATVAVVEQNGNDGASARGVVTGIHMTADGPLLVVGGRDIPLTAVTDVQS
jgi:flagellar basal-body rod modification protein FlgD